MSDQQLAALLAKLKDDAELRLKLQKAPDLDSAIAFAQDAGFQVSRETWSIFQAQPGRFLSDAEIESLAGGKAEFGTVHTCTPDGGW